MQKYSQIIQITVGLYTSCGMPDCVPAFTGTRCAYPQRDGQAELQLIGDIYRGLGNSTNRRIWLHAVMFSFLCAWKVGIHGF